MGADGAARAGAAGGYLPASPHRSRDADLAPTAVSSIPCPQSCSGRVTLKSGPGLGAGSAFCAMGEMLNTHRTPAMATRHLRQSPACGTLGACAFAGDQRMPLDLLRSWPGWLAGSAPLQHLHQPLHLPGPSACGGQAKGPALLSDSQTITLGIEADGTTHPE